VMIYNGEYAQPFCGGKTSILNCLIAKEYNKEHNDKPVSYGIKNKKKFQGAEDPICLGMKSPMRNISGTSRRQ
ncbi:3472_t:CDS:2, partial [Racocetra persica]